VYAYLKTDPERDETKYIMKKFKISILHVILGLYNKESWDG